MYDSIQSEELAQCAEILKELKTKPGVEPFENPVDWKALNLPDYPQIIKHPMDLATIGKKLSGGEYDSADEFAEDVRLVWKNAKRYNIPGSNIYMVAEVIERAINKKKISIKF
ncbi:hypothetical protein RFI_20881 [Reticulomyxa filosa]|uniref:Bromo domain-containing protein n=1 Tax=Reticulomyxa filosa TaxID=46433 RepID=X6MRN4_RETFI|nr:hypothetical protein RFI_20881 [Reticulomyxa filosa]|eukprot:ETO16459.1 hypothetical protein RFI_20881 [Reticulomyxa filosa]